MKRFHLFELEDQPWFPAFLRNAMTNYLSFVANAFGLHRLHLPTLRHILKRTGNRRIVDLAAGGGGPWRDLAPRLWKKYPELEITLTDRFPNIGAFQKTVEDLGTRVDFVSQPVDALDPPADLEGVRTMFLSFHHFRPEEARRILESAVRERRSILIMEAQSRDISHLLQFALSPLGVLLLTPAVRPLRLSQWFFTYLIPILPLAVMWDGVVSVLRTYTPAEMKAMFESIEGHETYYWITGVQSSGPIKAPYLAAVPYSEAEMSPDGWEPGAR
jgi:SAM-dependent methyltransferase